MQGSTAKPTNNLYIVVFIVVDNMMSQSNMGAAWSTDMANIESTKTFGKHHKNV